MSDGELIRPHDPFSGHVTPSAAAEPEEATEPPQEPPPPPEPAEEKAPPKRRGRRPRRVPTKAEVEAAKAKVQP